MGRVAIACRGAAAALWLALLASCGGGGGGGPSLPGAGDGTANPTELASGLLPAPSALGTTLAADATRLRILRPGATWRYAGHSVSGSYVTVVTHAASGGGVDEQSDNALGDGPESHDVRVAAGQVRQGVSFADLGLPGTTDLVELRSPVRINDQITQVDRRIADAVADLDGDGLPETLDFAVWTVVVGAETLDLAQRRSVQTVRVDTFFAARVRGSGGRLGPVAQGEQSVWYAEGIGIVRLRARVPGNTPGQLDETVEELDSWDGLTEGLGAQPTQTARDPVSGEILPPVRAAARFDTHALLLMLGGATDPKAFRLARVTPDARVTAVQEHALGTLNGMELHLSAESPLLLRMGNGAVALVSQVYSPGESALMRFDAEGQRLDAAPIPLVDGAGHPVHGILAADAEASSLWLLTTRFTDLGNSLAGNLELLGFDAAGAPLGPPTVLASVSDVRNVLITRLAAGAGRVVVTWALSESSVGGPVTTNRYAVFDASNGAPLALRDLVGQMELAPQPLAAEGLLALATSFGGRYGALSVARLDAAFDLIVGTSNGLAGEEVTPAWLTDSSTSRAVLGPGTIAMGAEQYIRRWPWQTNPEGVLTLLELPVLPGRLADATASLAGRIKVEGIAAPQLLVFEDRMLFYGNSSLATVWRPPH